MTMSVWNIQFSTMAVARVWMAGVTNPSETATTNGDTPISAPLMTNGAVFVTNGSIKAPRMPNGLISALMLRKRCALIRALRWSRTTLTGCLISIHGGRMTFPTVYLLRVKCPPLHAHPAASLAISVGVQMATKFAHCRHILTAETVAGVEIRTPTRGQINSSTTQH